MPKTTTPHPGRIRYQPLSPKGKALVDRTFDRLTRKTD